MKVTELANWNNLTPEEQARVREMYNVDSEDNLPELMTKSMAEPAPHGVDQGGE